MIPAPFQYHKPASVAEAAELLKKHGSDAKILAGGHSLIPLMKLRLAQPEVIIDIGSIESMAYVQERDGGIAVGGTTHYVDIANSSIVPTALSEAAAQVADVQVRNRGTIGGSLAHSDPAADLPAALIALKGQIITSSTSEHRTLESDEFFQDLFTTSLREDEIISEIFVPGESSGTGSAYVKFANKASHYAIVGVAASVTVSAGKCTAASIGITGAWPAAYQASASMSDLTGSTLDDAAIGKASAEAGEGVDFNDDVHASGEYRAHLVTVFTERAIRLASSRAG
tara:strand:- start:972 stop:1826 length:855 start_codon:yes stop_codon:yes gene_type:complete